MNSSELFISGLNFKTKGVWISPWAFLPIRPDRKTAERKNPTSKKLCNADGNPKAIIFFICELIIFFGKNF